MIAHPPGLRARKIPEIARASCLDMLQDVERADRVELLLKRDVGGVHLKEVRFGIPLPGELQPSHCDFTPRQRKLPEPSPDPTQDESRPAPDLAERPCARTIFGDRRDDKLVAPSKPEALLFEGSQQTKLVLAETARARACKLGRERHEAVDHRRLMRASGTAPIRTVVACPAARADLQPWLARVMPATISARPAIFGTVIGSPNNTPPAATTMTNVSATNG